ncbi:MAG: hypothetical protein EA393_04435 [Bacteroidetes bacterium]|nr:MAG: hypothetical protein EA393_04435 [Bacteroidota bacterium]
MKNNILAAGLVLSLVFTSCFDEKAFVEQYFKEIYQPQEMTIGVGIDHPGEYFIGNLTWYCYEKNHLCQSSSLQMIAQVNGIEKPLDYFSFLLGYTYGATYVKGAGMFAAYSDPEPGFITASNYLGLERKYFITDNPEMLIDNIKYYLSKNHPVRIAWNSALTMKFAMESGYFPVPDNWKEPPQGAFFPHSVVFVGYDPSHFYYYETHGMDFVLTGEKGIKIDYQSALEAISSFSTRYTLPWTYMMTVFEPGQTSGSIQSIFEQAGEEMIGRVLGPTSTGSYAIKGLSGGVRKEGMSIFNSPKKEFFKKTIESLWDIRRNNALFLENNFSEKAEILQIAGLLHSSADNYLSILNILEKENNTRDDVKSIRRLLDLSAELEREAGDIFLSLSKNTI